MWQGVIGSESRRTQHRSPEHGQRRLWPHDHALPQPINLNDILDSSHVITQMTIHRISQLLRTIIKSYAVGAGSQSTVQGSQQPFIAMHAAFKHIRGVQTYTVCMGLKNPICLDEKEVPGRCSPLMGQVPSPRWWRQAGRPRRAPESCAATAAARQLACRRQLPRRSTAAPPTRTPTHPHPPSLFKRRASYFGIEACIRTEKKMRYIVV